MPAPVKRASKARSKLRAPVNLRDLAARLSLSTSTVSRALNGYADVNAKTRRRIEAAARRLDYAPSPIGRRLRTGRAETIGVVLPRPQLHFITAFFLDLLTGIDEGLAATPYDLVVTPARGDDPLDSVRHMVESGRVDAAIFGRTQVDDPRIAWLQDRGVKFVAMGRSLARRPFAFLDIDHAESGRIAAERLAEAGHRRIALINTPAHLMYSRYCAQGVAAGLRAHGLEPDASLSVTEDLTEQGGFRAMSLLLARLRQPTAVVCGNDMMAFGAMRALKSAGLRVGADVAVIGCDDHPMARSFDPPLTTFTAPVREAGRRIAAMLLQLLDGARPESLQEVWKPELVARESDRARAIAEAAE
jgi:LacI family transcriptional regulator